MTKRRKSHTPITDELVIKIRILLRAGQTQEQTAAALNVSQATVSRYGRALHN
jgi:predicted transcriptional regulator